MGIGGVAINEAVALLDKLSRSKLEGLRHASPELAKELELGIMAGPEPGEASADPLLVAKCRVLVTALDEADHMAEPALRIAAGRIKRARWRRLVSQVFVLLGSSSILGALALQKNGAAAVSGVVTLCASLGTLLAENAERVVSPETGSIYDAFTKLGEGRYRAKTLRRDIELAVEYRAPADKLAELVKDANGLCEEINRWMLQVGEALLKKGGERAS